MDRSKQREIAIDGPEEGHVRGPLQQQGGGSPSSSNEGESPEGGDQNPFRS